MKMQTMMMAGVVLFAMGASGCHHLIHRRVHHGRHVTPRRTSTTRTTTTITTREARPAPKPVVRETTTTTTTVKPKKKPTPKPVKDLHKRHEKHKKGLKKLFR